MKLKRIGRFNFFFCVPSAVNAVSGDRPSEKGACTETGTTGRPGQRTNLSAVHESVPSGHRVGHPPGIGGAAGGRGHPDGELVGIVFGADRGGDRGDHQQRDQRRRWRRLGAAVDGVRRHRRAVCYCWRSRRLPALRPMRGRRRCRRVRFRVATAASAAATRQTFISGLMARRSLRRPVPLLDTAIRERHGTAMAASIGSRKRRGSARVQRGNRSRKTAEHDKNTIHG